MARERSWGHRVGQGQGAPHHAGHWEVLRRLWRVFQGRRQARERSEHSGDLGFCGKDSSGCSGDWASVKWGQKKEDDAAGKYLAFCSRPPLGAPSLHSLESTMTLSAPRDHIPCPLHAKGKITCKLWYGAWTGKVCSYYLCSHLPWGHS